MRRYLMDVQSLTVRIFPNLAPFAQVRSLGGLEHRQLACTCSPAPKHRRAKMSWGQHEFRRKLFSAGLFNFMCLAGMGGVYRLLFIETGALGSHQAEMVHPG